MAKHKQISSTSKTFPKPLDPQGMKAIKGGTGNATPPTGPEDVVIEDIINT